MTAAINPLNSVKGPAGVWFAAFGATEPAQTNAALIQDPSTPWLFLGATKGGVTWQDTDTYTDTQADQVPDAIGARLEKRVTTVKFNALEPTTAALVLALNSMGTLTVGTGITVYDPGQPNAGAIPQYCAILVDGQAPQLPGGGRARKRTIFRKVLNKPDLSVVASPTDDQVFAFSLQTFFVSSSISPWITMDQTA